MTQLEQTPSGLLRICLNIPKVMVIFFLPQELSCRGGVVNGWWDGGVEEEGKVEKKGDCRGTAWRGGKKGMG